MASNLPPWLQKSGTQQGVVDKLTAGDTTDPNAAPTGMPQGTTPAVKGKKKKPLPPKKKLQKGKKGAAAVRAMQKKVAMAKEKALEAKRGNGPKTAAELANEKKNGLPK